jgi:hypothetical protein
MISKLVTFGDSWTYGDELLSDEALISGLSIDDKKNDNHRLSHVFGGIIAKHYKLEFDNRGHNSASLQSMIWEFEHWLTSDSNISQSLVLFGLTSPGRMSWWKNTQTYIHSIQLENNKSLPKEFYDLNKYYRVCCSDQELYRMNYLNAVHLFSGMCFKLNIPCLLFNVFSCKFDIPYAEVINPNTGLVTILNEMNKDKTCRIWASQHPNENGHRLLAEYLIQHIDQKSLMSHSN